MASADPSSASPDLLRDVLSSRLLASESVKLCEQLKKENNSLQLKRLAVTRRLDSVSAQYAALKREFECQRALLESQTKEFTRVSHELAALQQAVTGRPGPEQAPEPDHHTATDTDYSECDALVASHASLSRLCSALDRSVHSIESHQRDNEEKCRAIENQLNRLTNAKANIITEVEEIGRQNEQLWHQNASSVFSSSSSSVLDFTLGSDPAQADELRDLELRSSVLHRALEQCDEEESHWRQAVSSGVLSQDGELTDRARAELAQLDALRSDYLTQLDSNLAALKRLQTELHRATAERLVEQRRARLDALHSAAAEIDSGERKLRDELNFLSELNANLTAVHRRLRQKISDLESQQQLIGQSGSAVAAPSGSQSQLSLESAVARCLIEMLVGAQVEIAQLANRSEDGNERGKLSLTVSDGLIHLSETAQNDTKSAALTHSIEQLQQKLKQQEVEIDHLRAAVESDRVALSGLAAERDSALAQVEQWRTKVEIIQIASECQNNKRDAQAQTETEAEAEEPADIRTQSSQSAAGIAQLDADYRALEAEYFCSQARNHELAIELAAAQQSIAEASCTEAERSRQVDEFVFDLKLHYESELANREEKHRNELALMIDQKKQERMNWRIMQWETEIEIEPREQERKSAEIKAEQRDQAPVEWRSIIESKTIQLEELRQMLAAAQTQQQQAREEAEKAKAEWHSEREAWKKERESASQRWHEKLTAIESWFRNREANIAQEAIAKLETEKQKQILQQSVQSDQAESEGEAEAEADSESDSLSVSASESDEAEPSSLSSSAIADLDASHNPLETPERHRSHTATSVHSNSRLLALKNSLIAKRHHSALHSPAFNLSPIPIHSEIAAARASKGAAEAEEIIHVTESSVYFEEQRRPKPARNQPRGVRHKFIPLETPNSIASMMSTANVQ